jgi:nucleoside-diphosphate-sugar epimerase
MAGLDQSGSVSPVPLGQLGEALRKAGRPDTMRVDPDLARELAIRNGFSVTLAGTVTQFGTWYSVVATAADPHDGRVISNFIVQALRDEPLTVYGDGTQTRSFCYVDDLVEGMIRMMDQDDEIGPVNLGNPVENTMLELAEKVLAATGSSSKPVHRPLPADDPKQRCPDITKAKRLLDWSPQVDLDTGLKSTVAYYRERLGL